MFEPQTIAEASEALRECSRARRTVAITGGERSSGPAAVAVDETLSARRLNRVLEYAPSDQIVTVESGMTLGALQATLREREQRLALDPPMPERLTVGAMVAGNGYGPLRTRYGTAKDVIVGMTIVRADGTVARGGGKVVKNVAGFDIPKLMIGTYGTLAMIASVTFRLHPLPRARATVRVSGLDVARVRALAAASVQAQLEPSAAVAVFDGAGYTYDVLFEGFAAGVAAQRERFVELAGAGESAAPVSVDTARDGEIVLKITAPPSELCALHERAVLPAMEALRDARAVLYPAVGAAFVSGSAVSPQGVPALSAARTWAEGAGGSLVVEAGAALRGAFDPWGTPPPSFALMRALKSRFDPQALLSPGGFIGGL